ncbi:MAG: hypothetical protein KAS66_06810 [Candidatus Omnitrophica bacterium]|nr:hypothetical protein [Candidatus Omnitrophota bacterium]
MVELRRKFNGKMYKLEDETFMKTDANKTAKSYREDGHKVRIIETSKGYAVYVR